MAFGFAGAGAGASDALQALLVRAFEQQQAQQMMALRQQEADRMAGRDAEQSRQFNARQALDEQEAVANQKFRAGQLDRQATQDRAAENDRGMNMMFGDYLIQRGQPMEGMAAQAGIDPRRFAPPEDPSIDHRNRMEEIAAQGKNALAVANARPRAEERLVQVMGPDGTPTWVRESEAVGKPAAQAARAVTGQERQALAYYNRAKDASDTLTNTGLEDRVAKAGIGTQLGLQYAPNMFQTGDQQAYRQAQRAFTEARLRKESGAAIPTGEYENDAKTYFAQPGDTAEMIAQKRKARQVVLDGLKFGSGKAYDEFYGASSAPQDSTAVKWGRDAQGRPVRLK